MLFHLPYFSGSALHLHPFSAIYKIALIVDKCVIVDFYIPTLNRKILFDSCVLRFCDIHVFIISYFDLSVNMLYIEKGHEPIVSPETFQMVQEEMRRRREAGSNMQCVSIFSSRIICGDCGGYYGRKIWHSSTKYTAWHWHCNAKFQKRKYCETPPLKEESLEETFVEVFNGLIADRDEIMENYRLCIDTVTDDSEYRRQLEDLNNGCGEVQTLIRSLLMTYSRQDTTDDIPEKLQEYEERLDTMARLKQELDLKIASCAAKRVQITGFLNELMKHDAPLAKFDPLIWQAVINYATVKRDCTITFTFRDGTEKTVPIKNGVRHYTKRNTPQEVDSNDG